MLDIVPVVPFMSQRFGMYIAPSGSLSKKACWEVAKSSTYTAAGRKVSLKRRQGLLYKHYITALG